MQLENIVKVLPDAVDDAAEAMMTLPDYTLYDIGHFYIKNNHTNELIQFDTFGRIPLTPETVERWVNDLRKFYPEF